MVFYDKYVYLFGGRDVVADRIEFKYVNFFKARCNDHMRENI